MKQLLYLRNRQVVLICQLKRTSFLCCISCKEDLALWRLELSRRQFRRLKPGRIGSTRSRSNSRDLGCSPRNAECFGSCRVRAGRTAIFEISEFFYRRAGWRSRLRNNRIRVAANQSTSCFLVMCLWSSLFDCNLGIV